MTRRKPVPGPQIFGDKVIYSQYIKLKQNASDTANFFNKGVANVYPSRKQVASAVKRHLAGTSASYWTKAHKKKGGRQPMSVISSSRSSSSSSSSSRSSSSSTQQQHTAAAGAAGG
jgi:hypothetical protein